MVKLRGPVAHGDFLGDMDRPTLNVLPCNQPSAREQKGGWCAHQCRMAPASGMSGSTVITVALMVDSVRPLKSPMRAFLTASTGCPPPAVSCARA